MRPIDADEFERELLCDMALHGEQLSGDAAYNRAMVILTQMPTLTPPDEPLPVLVNDEPGREYIDYICPRCRDIISQRRRGQRAETVYQCKYHDNCGQHVDWSNPRPYRRPPEGGA